MVRGFACQDFVTASARYVTDGMTASPSTLLEDLGALHLELRARRRKCFTWEPARAARHDNRRMSIFLETHRLTLRRFTEDDEDNLVELDSDPQVMRFLSGGRPTPREEVRSRILPALLGCYERFGDLGFWAAQEKATERFLGWFHFRPRPAEPRDGEIELGYRLRRPAWGKGYATEGSRALIRKGFTELGVERVVAETMAVNLGSRRVMEKAGLTFVRTFHRDGLEAIEGFEQGVVEYALTRGDWEHDS